MSKYIKNINNIQDNICDIYFFIIRINTMRNKSWLLEQY